MGRTEGRRGYFSKKKSKAQRPKKLTNQLPLTMPTSRPLLSFPPSLSSPLIVAQASTKISQATPPMKSKKGSKKRAAAPDPDLPTVKDIVELGNGEAADGVLVEDDLNEPTMGEKLESLNLLDNDGPKSQDKEDSSLNAKPPSADSVHILLKQALHAEDRALLLDCLYTQDEKVIAKSISLLNPSGVLKLLQSLISIIQSRGAILACALPWLRSLLLQHASGIVSQESSLSALNSLYQLIESRVSTFQSSLQLSSVLDLLYTGVLDDVDETGTTIPVVYEDNDDSDEEESEDAMDTDQDDEDEEESDAALDGVSDFEGIEDISD
ncbi:PREDICTED: WD [Prunus dulcis]|uniref:PREDICTED: WD n=1 Tax=Prunus dulcis TaxID=3755 RepID=A0A5E4F801_PRUDU|nr:PREDICTED: WD [Prunus dulcis]